jgi:hypothetical protein
VEITSGSGVGRREAHEDRRIDRRIKTAASPCETRRDMEWVGFTETSFALLFQTLYYY